MDGATPISFYTNPTIMLHVQLCKLIVIPISHSLLKGSNNRSLAELNHPGSGQKPKQHPVARTKQKELNFMELIRETVGESSDRVVSQKRSLSRVCQLVVYFCSHITSWWSRRSIKGRRLFETRRQVHENNETLH